MHDSCSLTVDHKMSLPSTNPEIQNVFDSQDQDLWKIEDLLNVFGKEPPQPSTIKSCFNIPPSKKDRGKDYFVHTRFRIVMTKSGAHFPVELKGIGIGDLIRISILYDNEDHMVQPVKCHNSNSGHTNVFQVMPRTPGLTCHVENEFGLCSATLINSGCGTDVVTFRVIPMCLNSCSRVCSDRILKLEHLSNDGLVLETSSWNYRVCSIPKRDFELMLSTIDQVTGEKRKSLYSKVPRSKKVKVEREELPAPPTPVEQGNFEAHSSMTTKQAMVDVSTREENEKAIRAAVELLVNNNAEGGTCQGPSSSGSIIDDVVINIYGSDTPALLEEKMPVGESSGTSEECSAPLAPPAMIVRMNSVEDQNVIKMLIRRLNGTMQEL